MLKLKYNQNSRLLNEHGHVVKYSKHFVVLMICFLFSVSQGTLVFGQDYDEKKQHAPIMIGQKLPEGFWTQEHLFYIQGDTIRKTMETYRGKPILLDFWATWCPPCIDGFSKVRSIQEKYKESFHVLLVNSLFSKDNYLKIHKMPNETLRSSELHTIINDAYLAEVFPFLYIPYYVWINTEGVLVATTLDTFVNDHQVLHFIDKHR